MVARFRVVAAASAIAVVGAFSTAVTQAGAEQTGGAGVSFTSQASHVQLVTHFGYSPTQSPGETASNSGQELRVPVLSPKGPRATGDARSTVAAAGAGGENNDTAQAAEGTPSTSSSFIGMQASSTICNYFGHGCNPPDMAVAASPQWVLQGVNTSFEVLDTSGNVQPGWPVNAQTFFNVPLDTNADGTPCDTAHGSRPFLSDPRAVYDPVDHRFWAAELQAAGVPALGIAGDCPLKSAIWVAVSQTSNPNGRWNVYEFNTMLDPGFFNDYTQIGLDRQAVYVSANMFQIDANGNVTGFYAELFEGNKSQMERGRASFTPDAFFNLQATGPGTTSSTGPFLADTVQPAVNLDSSAGDGETFVDTIDGPDPVNGHFCGFLGGGFDQSCSGLAVWKLNNPTAHDMGGPAPTLTGTYVPTKPFVVAPASTQPSCSQCVDSNDLRIPATVMLRNGSLYAAWGTAIDNGTNVVPGIEWARVDLSLLGQEDAATTRYFNLSGDASASYPALMPDAQGNVLMVYDRMSSTVFPEIRYIVKPAGDGNFEGTGALLKAGEGSYRPALCGHAIPVCRWGDYEATSWDGASHLWFASQYANTLNPVAPQYGRNWGTWIGAVAAA